MSVATIARPNSLRQVQWAVWVLLALAAALLVYEFTLASFSPIGAVLGIVPLLFAAAVLYVKPADRRYTWAALALAAMPVVSLIWNVVPEAVFKNAPGDWRNAAFLLLDAARIARDAASVLTIVGVGLLGLALGGMRTRLSAVILGSAGIVAVVHALGVIDSYASLGASYPPGDITPTINLVSGITISTFAILGWAFVFAAALESRRSVMPIGAGVIVGALALTYVPNVSDVILANGWDVLLSAIAAMHVVGWAVLIAAALRGELNAAPQRADGAL